MTSEVLGDDSSSSSLAGFPGGSDGKESAYNVGDSGSIQGHVATVGGDAFGDPDCFRMSYATSDDNIREAMRRIGEALKSLK